MTEPIYLDYNATTPVDPIVAEAIERHLRTHFGNPRVTTCMATARRPRYRARIRGAAAEPRLGHDRAGG